MKETPKQYLAAGQEVLVVGHDGKPHRARITEVIHRSAARCQSIDGKATSISEYSETGETNTFHFAPASAKAEQPKEANNKKE